MSIRSLSELCMENIAEAIDQAPPMIQEMIINDTSEYIKNKAVKQTVKEMDILPSLVASISKKIILSRSTFNCQPDFYEIYITVPRHIVKLAIEIAEMTIYEMNKSFNILTSVSSRYRFYTSDTQEDTGSDTEFHSETDTE